MPKFSKSEGETVLVQCFHNHGLPERIVVALANPIHIEHGVLAAQKVSSVLKVVLLEVVDDAATHVGVVVAGSKRREVVAAGELVEPPGHEPDGHDDQCEVNHDQSDTFLGGPNLNRVEVHVVLGGEVTVHNGVDLLEMVPARVLVQTIGLGVGSVPVTATGGLGHGQLLERGNTASRSEQFC